MMQSTEKQQSRPRDAHPVLRGYDKVLEIHVGHKGVGLLGYIHWAMNQILYAEQHNYLPVVNYDAAYGNYFFDPARGDNMWDYYLEPVAEYSWADIQRMINDPADPLSREHVVRMTPAELYQLMETPDALYPFPYGYWRDNPPEDLKAWYGEQRARGKRLVDEYIHFKQPVLDRVDEFYREYLEGHPVIGVHLRGTDMWYAPRVPAECYPPYVDRLIEETPEARLFVASDKEQLVEFMQQRYGDRVVSQDCLRSRTLKNAMVFKDRNPSEQGEEVLRDALLFSRCNVIVKGPGAVAEFARYTNPELEIIHVPSPRRRRSLRDFVWAKIAIRWQWR